MNSVIPMPKKEKIDKRFLYAIGVLVSILIMLNALIFLGFFEKRGVACYKDACLYGDIDPIKEFRDMIDSSNKVILIMEGDKESSQRTAYIDTAFAQLSGDFWSKQPTLIGIDDVGESPVRCICQEFDILTQNYTDCSDQSLEYCENIIPPDEFSFMIILEYPIFLNNEVIINNEHRIIEVRAKSGPDLLALVYFLRDLRE